MSYLLLTDKYKQSKTQKNPSSLFLQFHNFYFTNSLFPASFRGFKKTSRVMGWPYKRATSLPSICHNDCQYSSDVFLTACWGVSSNITLFTFLKPPSYQSSFRYIFIFVVTHHTLTIVLHSQLPDPCRHFDLFHLLFLEFYLQNFYFTLFSFLIYKNFFFKIFPYPAFHN